MSCTLHWRDLHLGNTIIPASQVALGEHVRLVMDVVCQYACLHHIFAASEYHDDVVWELWLEANAFHYSPGSQYFTSHIGSMIRQHGLIANLTLRENLLLPLLYRGDMQRLQEAEDELQNIAARIGLGEVLDEQAGERTAYTHALVSLGRCLLTKPRIIVAQEVHIGMKPEHLEHFRMISIEVLAQLGAGLLYLTSSPNDGSGLNFVRTLTTRFESSGVMKV